MENTIEKPRRGFATLSPDRLREIATMGGKAVKAENRSFSKNPALAASAGRKGGRNSHAAPANRDAR